MKIYEFNAFASPRRVRMFLAEKGIADGIDFEQVNVPEGEHREGGILAKNPYAAVPTLELDDGTCISETVAICRFFEERNPAPRLMRETPEEKAAVEMWQRRVENSVFNPIAAYFHHATPGLGPLETYQNPEWGNHSRDIAFAGMRKLDAQVASRSFIAGDGFTIADITAHCAIDFGALVDIAIPDDCANLKRWYGNVSARPSATA
jgi:glutathione S-transferase